MADFNIQLDTREVEEFNRAMPREIYNATRSAIRTTTTFAEKELEKRMSAATQIPLKSFKVYRVLSQATRAEGKVWFGFRAIKAKFVGEMKQDDLGAWAGSYFFRSGFIASINGGAPNLFKRLGKSRHPIVTQYVVLDENKSLSITQDVSNLAEQELQTRFSNKLRGYIERRESAA